MISSDSARRLPALADRLRQERDCDEGALQLKLSEEGHRERAGRRRATSQQRQGRRFGLLSCPRARVFLRRRCTQPFQGSSCMLLTGGPGSGKTVIAKQLAADLSNDFRLCLATSYYDCSPYSEERVPVLRARFSEWLNEAAWKAPSLLILDNIDRIIQLRWSM